MGDVDGAFDARPAYVGESRLIHYWPWCMLAAGLVALAVGSLGAVLVLLVPALVFARFLPWRFAVFDGGIWLWFGFGKRQFLAKEAITLRAGLGEAVVLPRGTNRLGYPLSTGFLDRDRATLRRVLGAHGFELSDG